MGGGRQKSRKSRLLFDTVPMWPWLLPGIPTQVRPRFLTGMPDLRWGGGGGRRACVLALPQVSSTAPGFWKTKKLEQVLEESPSRDKKVGLMLESEEK